MKKIYYMFVSAVVTLMVAVPAFAVDNPPPQKGQGQNFEQRKAEIIKRIDERIARNQEEKTCVQGANNHNDLKACRDKFKTEMQGQHQGRP
jgi:hypothetical protein